MSTRCLGRPKRRSALIKLAGDIESKAFAQSSARRMARSLFMAQVLSKSRLTMKSASAVPTPDLNPNWVGHISESVPPSFSLLKIRDANIL